MEFILRDRRTSYSFCLVIAGGVMAIVGDVEFAILNVLVAIWLKLP